MCLAVFSWQPGSAVPLRLVANRDEFRQRPTLAMHWWPDHDLLAGKDLQAGGTWLGFNRRGAFALLTNVRPGFIGLSSALSRGDLVREFLHGSDSIESYHRGVQARLGDYGGFNLVLGDGQRLFYFSSVHSSGQWLAPGIHGLSNDSLNTPWPKTELAKQQMRDWGEASLPTVAQQSILTSTEIVARQQLPSTGVPLAWEQTLSAQTIVGEDYGTRCRTLARQLRSGAFEVIEQQLDAQGQIVASAEFNLAGGAD
ncbi:NRDE family protein [Reinekea sp.]|jgi:uncharacterized protein with NRDE domain|uniref:NRDE family protein n=1 Tax=Reinekea sp. TaxID=1970455 RepID=UPI002A7F44E7|nr:NRDE family protein [Reinekea sp.]